MQGSRSSIVWERQEGNSNDKFMQCMPIRSIFVKVAINY